MTAEEKIITAIEEATGTSVAEDKIDAVRSRINMIFDYLGYEEKSSVADGESKKAIPGANGIDDELIKYLEELSRLTLTEDEEKKESLCMKVKWTELTKLYKGVNAIDICVPIMMRVEIK